jgi:uncharacterized membrane protein
MANDKFSISEALQYGWKTFSANVPFFLGLMVVIVLIQYVPSWIVGKIFDQHSVMFVLCQLVLGMINLLVGMAITRITLDVHDKSSTDLSRLGEILPLFPSYLGGKILSILIVLGGLLLLIVPGLIRIYMFMYQGYLIVDKGLGPIEALKESRAITTGYKWDLALLSFAVVFVNIGGAICLLIGLFVTIPVTLMDSAYVYRRFSPAPSR